MTNKTKENDWLLTEDDIDGKQVTLQCGKYDGMFTSTTVDINIDFENEFENIPVVTVTPQIPGIPSPTLVGARLETVSTKGFRVRLARSVAGGSGTPNANLTINWIAVSLDG